MYAPLCLALLFAVANAAPCDIFGSSAAGTPCVAAHSVVRALYDGYNGPLYQVKRSSDNSTTDISTVSAGGFADASAQDAFCAGTDCYIMRIYDQSPSQNHLAVALAGGAVPRNDNPVNATRLPVTVSGKKVYAAYFEGGQGYRNDTTTNMAVKNEEETLYMVTSGQHVNGGCCFDYGNAEIDNHDDGDGTMECVYFGTSTDWSRGSGNGPWVMADLENGLWAGNVTVNPNNKPLTMEFVTAMVKGGSNGFALKGGDAMQGKLNTMWDGPRPQGGYQPMSKQGAILLGIGGDNSNSAIGTFFEGCIVQGYTTDEADDAVQADIVAVGYGQ